MSESTYWSAIRENDLDAVRSQLETNPDLVSVTFPGDARKLDLESSSPFKNTALHHAVLNNRVELVKTLLEAGAQVNQIGYEPSLGLAPPLSMAVIAADAPLMSLLLEHGADANLAASVETPLYTAVEKQFPDKVQLLLDHGARQDVFTAAISGDSEMVVYFLEAYPALLKARSLKRNRTPWEEAATHEQDDVMAAVRSWTEKDKAAKAAEPKTSGWGGGDDDDDHWGGSDPKPDPKPTPKPAAKEKPATEPVKGGPSPVRQVPRREADDWETWADPDSAWPG